MNVGKVMLATAGFLSWVSPNSAETLTYKCEPIMNAKPATFVVDTESKEIKLDGMEKIEDVYISDKLVMFSAFAYHEGIFVDAGFYRTSGILYVKMGWEYKEWKCTMD